MPNSGIVSYGSLNSVKPNDLLAGFAVSRVLLLGTGVRVRNSFCEDETSLGNEVDIPTY